MCFKKIKKKVSQSARWWLWFVLTLLFILIVICLVLKFFPTNIPSLGIRNVERGDLMSFIELIIEAIFCILVWHEFKMTRKSFEWQKEEQEKRNNEEAARRLSEILKLIFTGVYFRSSEISRARSFLIQRREWLKCPECGFESLLNKSCMCQECDSKNRFSKRYGFSEIESKAREFERINSELKELHREEFGSIKDMFLKFYKDSKGKNIDFEKEEVDLIETLVAIYECEFIMFRLSRIDKLSRYDDYQAFLESIKKCSLAPEYISNYNLDRKVIESCFNKMFF